MKKENLFNNGFEINKDFAESLPETVPEQAPVKGKELVEWLEVLCAAIIAVVVIFCFVFRIATIDGNSMNHTLHHNDRIIITNLNYEPKNGDIVVITQDTWFNAPLIKRVIATGGQVIDIDEETETVTVDGKVLDEPYIREDFINDAGIHDYPYTVPEGYLFCMGDNRNGSTDSRFAEVGVIDEREILGKAVVRILPFGDFDIYDYE